MRHITILIAVFALVVAGCSGTSDDDAATTEDPETTTQATRAPTTTSQSVAPAAEKIEVEVVFDGETCSYFGPAVVPKGTRMSFDFKVTGKSDDIALVVGDVDEGTTLDDIVEWSANNPADVVPPFAGPDIHVRVGPGLMVMTFSGRDYAVLCTTAPTDTNIQHPAALIDVVRPGIEAKVVFDGETCTYLGPATIRAGTEVTFKFEATAKPDKVALVVGAVHEGTTWEEIVEWSATNPAQSVPSFVRPGYGVQYGPGSLVLKLEQGHYGVICNTAPDDTDTPHPAALIEVTEG